MENFESLFLSMGYQMDWASLNIILPVGISFYTFQALSYTIDVYRGKIAPTKDIIEFFAYISFFPQLVAGPIERATNLLPQFQKDRHFDYNTAVDGMRQMLWGFFKKLVVADNCAYVVNYYWDAYPNMPGFSILFAGLMFTFQIYCDFSGYSDIAIGCSRLFGFNLMQNFNYPYFSQSIPDFWRRWHISLMTWFRDYVYFPLGGSRCSRWKTVRNTLIVFFISGLWHGANWTFILWGIYHATIISIYILLGINNKPNDSNINSSIYHLVKPFIRVFITFSIVIIGWIIFRAENITQLYDLGKAITSNSFFDSHQIFGKKYIFHILFMITLEWVQRDKRHALQFSSQGIFRKRSVRWILYVLLYLYIITSTGQSQTFLYFQF